jgi:pyrimidine operon attenuation protein/uracil phosphoribosyltransferase
MAEPLVDAETIARSVRRIAVSIADEVVKSGAKLESLAIVGILRGGLPIAQKLAEEIGAAEGRSIPVGAIDIGLYRDDAALDPDVQPSAIAFDVGGRDVVLVDDVLQTGRTVRAAIDALLDYGRPRRVWLAVLFDRGGRELPIAADFVGRAIELEPKTKLEVDLDHGAFVRARS